MRKVDYLIVGQGIAGTLLALQLIKEEKSVYIINKETIHTSSNKAAGLYNPITGRKMIKSWLADQLFESIEKYYQNLERQLGAKFLYSQPIYRPFFSIEEQNDWQGKASLLDYQAFVKEVHNKTMQIEDVIDPFGGIEISKCGSVDVPHMITSARIFFKNKGDYRSDVFDYNELDETLDEIKYKDIVADTIIFCEGPDAMNNPYTNHLPFKLVKGEVLDVETNLDKGRIVNRGVFMVPRNSLFKVGSTYDHSVLDHNPTEKARQNIEERLGKIYTGKYKIVNHTAGIRPATYDRKPLIGLTGLHKRIGVFNGLGAKGVSLAPFFATQFVNYLLGKEELNSEILLGRGK